MGPHLITQVRRTKNLSRERFEQEFVRSGSPVVVEGLFDDWPALAWDFSNVAELWPNRPVTVEEFPSGDPFDATSRREYKIEIGDFVRRLSMGAARPTRPPPALFCIVRNELPELVPSMPSPSILGTPKHVAYNLVAGRDNIVFGHYQLALHAMLGQIRGTKRVILCPPEDSALLYPYPIYGPNFSTSRVDFAHPDLGRFPKFAGASRCEAVLEPGDALFVPARFWHATYGKDFSMTASLFWKASWRERHFPRRGFRDLIGTALTIPRVRLQRAVSRVERRLRARR